MSLTQLIYASRPFGFDEVSMAGILMDARRWNTREEITGALICRADIYLQLLEGPDAAIEAAYHRIRRDDRHMEMRLLSRQIVEDRLFPAWTMRDDPARSWFWTKAELDAGALDRASEAEVLAVFTRISTET